MQKVQKKEDGLVRNKKNVESLEEGSLFGRKLEKCIKVWEKEDRIRFEGDIQNIYQNKVRNEIRFFNNNNNNNKCISNQINCYITF